MLQGKGFEQHAIFWCYTSTYKTDETNRTLETHGDEFLTGVFFKLVTVSSYSALDIKSVYVDVILIWQTYSVMYGYLASSSRNLRTDKPGKLLVPRGGVSGIKTTARFLPLDGEAGVALAVVLYDHVWVC